jgi:Fe-S cluster assembly protein SufD
MSGSLQQYLDLYDANRDAIHAASAPAFNALRDIVRPTLNGRQLPSLHDEGYEKTSLDQMFAPDFGLNIARVNLPVDIAEAFRCDVPNLSSLLAIVANDAFVPSSTLTKNLPDGVKVMSLRQALIDIPQAADLYGTIAPTTDIAVALNSLLVQDGVYIQIDKGVRLEKPLQIVNIFACQTPLMAARRILINAADDSAANILICDHSQGDSKYLSCQVVEVACNRGSNIQIYDIEESSPNTSRCNRVYVRQLDQSHFLANATTLLNGSTRNDFNISIQGQHAVTGLYGMAIGSGSQHIDNSSSVVHAAPHSTSNQLFKYVLDEKATGAFEGGIEVTPQAPFTEAFQSNNNVLASVDARMHTKPQLLIYNDEVKCSHGATTGQLDNAALFYMQTRGIPQAEARTMLMQAFMIDVIQTVQVEGLRDRLRHLVEKRFAGSLASCSTCASCKP